MKLNRAVPYSHRWPEFIPADTRSNKDGNNVRICDNTRQMNTSLSHDSLASGFSKARERMVDVQIEGRGINAPLVVAAMLNVPREMFVDPADRRFAYMDGPLSIGEGQTISQPFIVALMLEAAEIGPDDIVLEVGTGSGYAAAVASRIARKVHTIERHGSLAEQARSRFRDLRFENIDLLVGDGTLGWVDASPFDAILVSAGGPDVPAALKQQLVIGGRLIIPVRLHDVD